MLISIERCSTCDLPGGGGSGPLSPIWIRTCNVTVNVGPMFLESRGIYLLKTNKTDRMYCPANRSDSDLMFCLQSYQGLRIDRSLVH